VGQIGRCSRQDYVWRFNPLRRHHTPSADVRNAVWQLAVIKKNSVGAFESRIMNNTAAMEGASCWTKERDRSILPNEAGDPRCFVCNYFFSFPSALFPSPLYKWTSRLNGRTGIVRTHRGRTKAASRIFIFTRCPARCYQVVAAMAGSVRRRYRNELER